MYENILIKRFFWYFFEISVENNIKVTYRIYVHLFLCRRPVLFFYWIILRYSWNLLLKRTLIHSMLHKKNVANLKIIQNSKTYLIYLIPQFFFFEKWKTSVWYTFIFKFWDSKFFSWLSESRSSKIKKILLPLLILLKLKGAIVITVVLAVIALISFKGLGASLIALAISGATGFKSLLENHSAGSKVYEVLPSLSASHWSRVGVDPMSSMYPGGFA